MLRFALSSNWGAGMTDNLLSHNEVLELMNEENDHLRKMISNLVHDRKPGNCRCAETGFARFITLTNKTLFLMHFYRRILLE